PVRQYGHCAAAGHGSLPPWRRTDNSGLFRAVLASRPALPGTAGRRLALLRQALELYKFILSSFGSECKLFFLFKVHFFQSAGPGGISRRIRAPRRASMASKAG